MISRSLRAAALLAGLIAASTVRAHAPLPRAVAISSEGAVAVRMPGFGWLMRGPDDAAFSYACDPLLGVSPLEEHAPMAYRSDGALLVGTAHGVRVADAHGCPIGDVRLEGLAISALAAYGDLAYVIAGATDQPAALYASDDGGDSWQRGADVGAATSSTIAFDAFDASTVYVSQALGPSGATLLVSRDGGGTFEALAQERAIMVVAAQATAGRLWGTARIEGQGVGASVLRAEQPSGPWAEVLQVNFFGGLAIDPENADVIWVGDEARGVFRSDDGGERFEEPQPDISSAALAYGAGALWACTPGLPEQPALMRSPDALEPFEPALAFRDVTELATCAPPIDASRVCAGAWIEWRRDVLGVPKEELVDAGSEPAPPDAGDDAAVEAPGAHSANGCGVLTPRASPSAAWLALAAAITLRALRRRSRGCALPACRRTAARPRTRRAARPMRPRSRSLGRS